MMQQQQPQQQQDLELFSLKRCIPPANRHGKMGKKMTQQMETNIQNQIFQSLFWVHEQRQFCLMQDQKNYRSILVHISQKLPLISNMLIRNIS